MKTVYSSAKDMEEGRVKGHRGNTSQRPSSPPHDFRLVLVLLVATLMFLIPQLILVPPFKFVGVFQEDNDDARIDSHYVLSGSDVCENATEVPVDGTVVHGTFQGVAAEAPGPYCNDFRVDKHRKYPLLWYKFRGTGTAVRVQRSYGYHNIAVYSGECDSLQTDSYDDRIFGSNSDWLYLSWRDSPVFYTKKDKIYYLFVVDCDTKYVPTKEFGLSVETVGSLPENNSCEGALALPTDGSMVHQDVHDATWDNMASPCSKPGSECLPGEHGLPGVWYSVSGTHGHMRLVLSDDRYKRSALGVYTGECAKLSRIPYNRTFEDTDCPTSTGCVVSLDINIDDEGKIYVYVPTGRFGLSVQFLD